MGAGAWRGGESGGEEGSAARSRFPRYRLAAAGEGAAAFREPRSEEAEEEGEEAGEGGEEAEAEEEEDREEAEEEEEEEERRVRGGEEGASSASEEMGASEASSGGDELMALPLECFWEEEESGEVLSSAMKLASASGRKASALLESSLGILRSWARVLALVPRVLMTFFLFVFKDG